MTRDQSARWHKRNIRLAASDVEAQRRRRATRRERYLAYLTALYERKKKNDKNH